MIKGDVQISEEAINLSPIQLQTNLGTNFSIDETKTTTLIAEKINNNLELKIHFTRLKKRMRTRSASIF